MLAPRKALLLGRRHGNTVDQQRRRGIVKNRVDSQHIHGTRSSSELWRRAHTPHRWCALALREAALVKPARLAEGQRMNRPDSEWIRTLQHDSGGHSPVVRPLSPDDAKETGHASSPGPNSRSPR